MPQAANITVKKNDGTTDVVWTLIAPAGGDGFTAMWRNETVSGPMNVRPVFTFLSKSNGPKTARRCDLEVSYPQAYTDTTTGLVKVANKAIISVSGLIPLGMDTTQLNEAISQAVNLFASTLVKDSLKSGTAPT